MNKNKNQKRKVALSQKKALTTLQFQAEWGLKQLNGRESILQQQLSNELTLIEQLDLTQDLLAIQKFTIHVQQHVHAHPLSGHGDLTKSLIAITLGIVPVESISPDATFLPWSELAQKKMLSLYYPEETRNAIVAWAAQNGYQTSTYLGIIRKSKFPQNPKRSVRFSGKRTKRSVQKRKARNTQKAETKVL